MTVRIESHAEPIPGYRLIERLGGGGFGEVWKATAPGGLLKAIKFVYGDLQTAQSEDGVRAEQELKAMSRVKTVRHPYILSLERYDIIDGQLIIVMELADRNLWDRFKECQGQGLPGIPREELLGYMAEIAEALDLMNQEFQLQHLDIKPQNLFLVHNHVKVADFGLVKDLEGMVASVTGGVTPVYAAPETFDGWVSRYSDQYSLAIVYQELLTGQRPFKGNNVRQLILQHLQAAPDLTPLPAHDRDAIGRALNKNPDDRHPFCKELVQALRGARGPAGSWYPGAGPDSFTGGELPPRPTNAPEEPPASTNAVTHRFRNVPEAGGPLANQDKPIPASGEIEAAAATPDEPEELHSTPRPVQRGEGMLFPALVIGLGNTGREVLKRFSAHLTDRFGTPLALPQIRLLYLDTDPDGVRLASAGKEEESLRRGEVLLTPLHRASQYINPRPGKLKVDSWLDTKMLYRIPRQANAGGVRALGRLAFVDNFRTIALRLRREMQECTDPAALAEAAQQTGLGMRRDDPRVYVIASLSGGTGSGMFLDLAYVVRTLLRQMGYLTPDLIGLFLLPPADAKGTQTQALGNAYAALAELYHFSSPDTVFHATYDSKENPVLGPIADPGSPFQRCFFLPIQSTRDAEGRRNPSGQRVPSSLNLACNFLLADLTTPLGRSADKCREEGARGEGRGAREEEEARGEGRGAREEEEARGEGRGAREEEEARGEGRGAREEEEARGEGRGAREEEEARGEGRGAREEEEEGARGEGRGAREEEEASAEYPGGNKEGDSSLAPRPSPRAPSSPRPAPLLCQTFGLYRLVWPRRTLVRQTARRICRILVERWMSKDSNPVKEQVQQWVKEQWGKQDLGPEHLIARFQEAGDKALKRPVESVLADQMEPLTAAAGAQAGTDVDPDAVVEVLKQLELLLGKPKDEGPAVRPGKPAPPARLEEVLRAAGENLSGQFGQKMAELAVCLIEEPAFRLAGAEEAIRQLTLLIEQTLEHHEQFTREIAERSLAAFGGILANLKALRGTPVAKTASARRGGWFGGANDKLVPSPQEILEQIRSYAKSRHQYLIMQQVTALYVSLRGQLSDQMREVGYCRNRLQELARTFQIWSSTHSGLPEMEDGSAGLARILLPPGCKDLPEAVERLVEGVLPADLEELDRRIEVLIRKESTALVEVCLGPANQIKSLEAIMQQEAEAALGSRLAEASAVDMFLAQQTGEGEEPPNREQELADAFSRAEPEQDALLQNTDLSSGPGYDILTAPARPAAETLKELISQAFPQKPVLFVTAAEARAANEILIYRETPIPSLADLALLGPQSREAYLQMTRVDHFTPHTRIDIAEWLPVKNKEVVSG